MSTMAKRLAFVALLLIPLALVARLLWGVKPNILVEARTVPLEALIEEIPEPLRLKERRDAEADSAWQGLLLAAQRTRRLSLQTTEALDKALYEPASLARLDTMATLEETFERHATNMTLAAEMASRPSANVGSVKAEENPVNSLRGLQTLVTLFGRRGTVRIYKGEIDAGVADLITAHRIGERILGSGGPIFQASLGASLIARAGKEIRIATRSANITDAALQRLAAALPSENDLRAWFKRSLRSEMHWFVVNEVARLRGPGGNSGVHAVESDRRRDIDSGWRDVDTIAAEILRGHAKPFDRRQTVRDAIPIYEALIENVDLDWERQHPVEERIRSLIADWPKAALSGRQLGSPVVKKSIEEMQGQTLKSDNPYGRLAIWYFIPVSDQNRAAPFRARAEVGATRLMLAIRRYELKNGVLPPDLGTLESAGLLNARVSDPFTGGAYRYRSDDGKLWSAGIDGKDDGGAADAGNSHRARDFVWRIEPALTVKVADAKLVAEEVTTRRLTRETPIGEIRRMTRGGP
jgi:hypothetical protein